MSREDDYLDEYIKKYYAPFVNDKDEIANNKDARKVIKNTFGFYWFCLKRTIDDLEDDISNTKAYKVFSKIARRLSHE